MFDLRTKTNMQAVRPYSTLDFLGPQILIAHQESEIATALRRCFAVPCVRLHEPSRVLLDPPLGS